MFDQVFLTGFKKFGNCVVNPTELICEEISKYGWEGLQCKSIEVAVEDVDQYIEQIKQSVKGKEGKKILNVHLGVGPNKVYLLEMCGFNNKDFPIPDNKGNVFHNQQICPKNDLEHPLHCKLDLDSLIKQLSSDFKLQKSNDPGRYLCNYIYFKSLHELACPHDNISSLFIHIPTTTTPPTTKTQPSSPPSSQNSSKNDPS